jgi:hypothetical protein
MKRSTVAVPARQRPRRVRAAPRSAALRPPVAKKAASKSTESLALPVSPFIPSMDQNLECCLLGLRDCLVHMRQTEITDRSVRAIDRTLKLLAFDQARPPSNRKPAGPAIPEAERCLVCQKGFIDPIGQCPYCGSIRRP